MDPVSIGSTFASIVGLLGVWKSEVDERESREFQQFLDWLQRHRHEQIVSFILGNHELSLALKSIVETQHAEVLAMLRRLDGIMTTVASGIEAFQDLAFAANSDLVLSDQAKSILHQMNAMGASSFLEVQSSSGSAYIPHDGKGGGHLKISEPRFIDDDLLLLVEHGLLRLDYGGRGSRIFRITRAGAAIGDQAIRHE